MHWTHVSTNTLRLALLCSHQTKLRHINLLPELFNKNLWWLFHTDVATHYHCEILKQPPEYSNADAYPNHGIYDKTSSYNHTKAAKI